MRVRCPVLVGRSHELETLWTALEGARAGRGGVVLVESRPGVGKSRLVRTFAREAAEAGVGVGIGGTSPSDVRPLQALAEGLLPLTVNGLDSAVLGPYAAALTALLPGAQSATPVSTLVLAEAVVRLALQRSPQGYLLLVEDLHWADPDTVAVLRHLCRQAHRAALLIVVTSRPITGMSPLHEEELGRIALEPLDAGQVKQMVDACGRPPGADVDAAEGVPLLVEELLGLATDQQPAADQDVLRTLVRARLGRLGPDTRAVVAAAALMSVEPDVALLCRAFADVDVDMHVAAAIDNGVLERGTGLTFRHALTRDAVLAIETSAVRQHAGTRLLAVLGPQPAPGAPTRLAIQVAVALDDPDTAVRLGLQAARQALAIGLLRTADDDLRRALQRNPSADLRADVLRSFVECACAAGRLDDALAAADELFTLRPDRPDADAVHRRLARAAADAARWEVAQVHLAAAGSDSPETGLVAAVVQAGQGRLAEASRAAAAVAEAAQRLGDHHVSAQAMEVVGRCARSLGDADAALAAFEQARACAVRAHSRPAQLSALHELGTIDMLTSGRRDRLEAAAGLADELGDARLSAVIALQSVALHHMHGDAQRTLECARRAAEEADALGLSSMAVAAYSFLPTGPALLGDMNAVEAGIAQAHEHGLSSDPDALAGTYGSSRAFCALLREERDVASTAFEKAATIVRKATLIRPQPWWGYWALVRAVEGHPDAVDAVAQVRASPSRICVSNLALASLAEAVLAGRAGRLADANGLVEQVNQSTLPWAWHYHLSRRLVAEAALADGWGDPRRWLRDAEEFFRAWYTEAVAEACARLLSRTPAAVPAWLAHTGITSREAEVLRLLALGLRDREVAERLFLSPRTVEKHVEALRRKLGAASRGELIALAARGRPAAQRDATT